MKRPRSGIAPALLVVALLFPLTMAEAQQARPKQRRAHQRMQTTDATQSIVQDRRRRRGRRVGATADSNATTTAQGKQSSGGKTSVTVVRRVNQATVSASMINRLRSIPLLRRMVTFRGRTIRPSPGTSIFLLSNRGYLVLETDEPDVDVYASEWVLKKTLWGTWLIQGCWCPRQDGQDDCRIGSVSRRDCYSENNAETCCSFAEVEVEDPFLRVQ